MKVFHRSITWLGDYPVAFERGCQAVYWHIRAAIRIKHGELLKLCGQWDLARQEITDAVEEARLAYSARIQAEALRSLGFLLIHLGHYNEAMKHLEEARSLFASIGDLVGEAEAIGNLGSVYLNSGDIAQAERQYKLQLEKSRALADQSLRISSLNNLGVVKLYRGEYGAAIALYSELLELSLSAGSLRGQSSAHGNMALAYLKRNEYQEALCHYQADLAICRRMGDKGNLARVHANFGDAYFQLGDYVAARHHLSAAQSLCQELGDKRGESYIFGLLGAIMESKGDVEGALDQYERAIALSREIGAVYFVGVYLNNKASLLFDMGRYDEATECNRSAAEVVSDSGVPDDIFSNLLLAAKILARRDPAVAMASLDKLMNDFGEDEEKRAGILRARFLVYGRDEDLAAAREIYSSLYSKSGNPRYKQLMEEIQQRQKKITC